MTKFSLWHNYFVAAGLKQFGCDFAGDIIRAKLCFYFDFNDKNVAAGLKLFGFDFAGDCFRANLYFYFDFNFIEIWFN